MKAKVEVAEVHIFVSSSTPASSGYHRFRSPAFKGKKKNNLLCKLLQLFLQKWRTLNFWKTNYITSRAMD
jgi:hypothetical protein